MRAILGNMQTYQPTRFSIPVNAQVVKEGYITFPVNGQVMITASGESFAVNGFVIEDIFAITGIIKERIRGAS